MRAQIGQCKEIAANVEDADRPIVDVDDSGLPRLEFVDRTNLDQLFYDLIHSMRPPLRCDLPRECFARHSARGSCEAWGGDRDRAHYQRAPATSFPAAANAGPISDHQSPNADSRSKTSPSTMNPSIREYGGCPSAASALRPAGSRNESAPSCSRGAHAASTLLRCRIPCRVSRAATSTAPAR